MSRIIIKVVRYKCLRCGRKWLPRSSNYPRTCPKCKSPYWDKPRKPEKGRGVPIAVFAEEVKDNG